MANEHRNKLLVRLLSMLRDLDRRRDGMGIEELAARYQVATRTIRRDLDALQEAGLPLTSEDDGHKKRWKLEHPDPRRQLANVIDASHFLALSAAIGGAAGRGSVSHDTLADLARKLRKSIGAKDCARVEAVADCFVRGERGSVVAAGPDVLWPMMEAITARKVCNIAYHAPHQDEHQLCVLPLKLFTYNGAVYVLAHDHGRDHVITLALHRVKLLDVTKQTAAPPSSFDAEAYVGSLFGVFGEGHEIRYRLRFSAEVAPYIRERQWHPSQQLRPGTDGRVILDFTCLESFEISAWIASWRHHVTVLAPQRLRRELRELGEELVQRYK